MFPKWKRKCFQTQGACGVGGSLQAAADFYFIFISCSESEEELKIENYCSIFSCQAMFYLIWKQKNVRNRIQEETRAANGEFDVGEQAVKTWRVSF